MGYYAYEVTTSNVETVQVGTILIDQSDEPYERGEPRAWTLYNETTGDFYTGFVGLCLHRICGPCRDQGYVREQKHNGRHGIYGQAPTLIPERIGAGSA